MIDNYRLECEKMKIIGVDEENFFNIISPIYLVILYSIIWVLLIPVIYIFRYIQNLDILLRTAYITSIMTYNSSI